MRTERHRIALISDVHGNQIALREVLRSIDSHGTDEVVFLGDIATLGVAPGEVVDRIAQLGCRCVMGNHDDYILDPELDDAHSDGPSIAETIDWCRDQLSREQIEFIGRFEHGFELPLGEHHHLKLFHGSPDSNTVDLLAETPADTFDAQLGPERATVMAGGHTHIQMLRQHRGALVVNPGSVGAAFREFVNGGTPVLLDHAEYATVEAMGGEVSVTLHRVGLDRHELAKAARESAIPMRELLLEQYEGL
ncbi:MAG: metallophosphoesterase family protein [Myxococcota bacterium]